jgi:hypothetical protein
MSEGYRDLSTDFVDKSVDKLWITGLAGLPIKLVYGGARNLDKDCPKKNPTRYRKDVTRGKVT